MSLFPFVAFERVSLQEANRLLEAWGHRMGPLCRGNQEAICHALMHEGRPEVVTTTSTLIMPRVGGVPWMTRENTIELSRLCANRSGLCRVGLRLWREYVFPPLGYAHAMSYQDADMHSGNTYRFDGWKRVGHSHSGTDTRSGRPGRNKWVWTWPEKVLANSLGK